MKFCCAPPRRKRPTSPAYGRAALRAPVTDDTRSQDSANHGASRIDMRRSRSSSISETGQSRPAIVRPRRSHGLDEPRRADDTGDLGFLFNSRQSKSRIDLVAHRKAMQKWKQEQAADRERDRASAIANIVSQRVAEEVAAIKKREISDNALLSGFRPQMEREFDRLVYEEGAEGPLEQIAQLAIANIFDNADGSVNAVREAHGGFMRR